MRILLLCTGLKTGGAEQQVAGLAQAFVRDGHDVAIVSLTPGCEVTLPASATVVHLNMRKTVTSMVRALRQLNRFVKQWQPQVIHAHMVHANLLARMLAAVTAAPPVICTAHSAREGGRLRMLAYRLTDNRAALTTHVSEAGRQAMISAGAVAPERIRVMPNGIDTALFRPDPAQRQARRSALGVNANTRVVINVGRLVPEKAQHVLLEAIARLVRKADSAKSSADLRLFIVGEGPVRSALEASIGRLGLQGVVTLLGMRQDVPALLNAADVFALSSDIEGMPLVIGEALSSGCAVVATDAAGVAELLGNAGKIVPRGNAEALADALDRAMASGVGTYEEQTARRQRIVEKFSLEAVARQWVDCYAGLAGVTGNSIPKPPR
ncbi:glycosyltransferase [Cupriavidus oxalaticus]|nr:glycosyltransferase [Cupriavidus oxalaticus]QRQ88159.1 glycosyltransferase [Cupriavidus oxalaticus]QRQ93515.1 glycosyltransferase [Cupriavidus oxalaticus]WQD82143.1 glycosyltransferase [Cupriavidus oxalaticus]SPC08558.1 Glycosyl transferase, group 1 [Cupriavidus oxalaticus]